MVTIRIPAPSSMLLSNMLGLLGLIGIVIAVGALTDWRWGLLTAGAACIALALIGASYASQTASEAETDAAVTQILPLVKPRRAG